MSEHTVEARGRGGSPSGPRHTARFDRSAARAARVVISPARRVLIDHYTSAVIAARRAYRADRTNAQGLCATCERNKVGVARDCEGCRKQRALRKQQ